MSPTYPAFRFEITARARNCSARTGLLTTPHGTIPTPNFIFCATKGAMKSLTAQQMEELGADIILSNTYHLFLRPGPEGVARLGGLHKMLGWNKPMLTDSGGFQIFSLGHGTIADEIKGRNRRVAESKLLSIREDGAIFKSYIDGADHILTPEIAMDAQRKIGADLVLTLDECTPFHVDRVYTARSMERSHRWALRSLEEFKRHDDGRQALYGIVQGGVYPDLRAVSAAFNSEQPFFGLAIGGSLGAHKDQMQEVISYNMPHIHPSRPVHLLGIGGISDIWRAVAQGIDTFDCVQPSRIARHGGALTFEAVATGNERMNLRNACYNKDYKPIEEECTCYCCRNYSRAYVHYLLKADELLGGTLLTIHNCAFMVRLMKAIRTAIAEDRFNPASISLT